MSGRLDGKVALVTGASRGIGRATAQLLAREGAAVIVNFAERREAADAVVEDIRRAGGQAIAIQANVADRNEVFAMVEQGFRQFSRIEEEPIGPSLEFEITCHVSTLASPFNADFTTRLGWQCLQSRHIT